MMHEREGFDLTEVQRQALHHTLIWVKNYFDNIPSGVHIGGHGFDKTLRQAGMAAVISSWSVIKRIGRGFRYLVSIAVLNTTC